MPRKKTPSRFNREPLKPVVHETPDAGKSAIQDFEPGSPENPYKFPGGVTVTKDQMRHAIEGQPDAKEQELRNAPPLPGLLMVLNEHQAITVAPEMTPIRKERVIQGNTYRVSNAYRTQMVCECGHEEWVHSAHAGTIESLRCPNCLGTRKPGDEQRRITLEMETGTTQRSFLEEQIREISRDLAAAYGKFKNLEKNHAGHVLRANNSFQDGELGPEHLKGQREAVGAREMREAEAVKVKMDEAKAEVERLESLIKDAQTEISQVHTSRLWFFDASLPGLEITIPSL